MTSRILPVAVGAFAIVAFLLFIDFSLETFGPTRTNVANRNSNQGYCTDDAKLCPDGSSVGRTGLNCEFTLCPGEAEINSFTKCEAGGYPVAESYPRQCRANGQTFTETITNTNASADKNTNSTVEQTSEWKTYTNKAYTYSFQHPAEYKYVSTPNGLDNIRFDRGQPNTAGYQYLIFSVLTANETGDYNRALYSWAQQGFPGGSAAAKNHDNPRRETVGKNTFLVTDGDRASSGVPEYFLFKNNFLYFISSYAGSGTQELNRQIISTFQVTEVLTRDIYRHSSESLGLSFTYKSTGEARVTVTESTDKVFVNVNLRADEPVTNGQWVQKFAKGSGETLAQAIERLFLVGYSKEQCFVKKHDYKPAGWEYATISFPLTESESEPWWAKAEDCPEVYTSTNGISYFAMDPKHPTRFYYFSIGQYAIMANSTDAWQQVVQSLD